MAHLEQHALLVLAENGTVLHVDNCAGSARQWTLEGPWIVRVTGLDIADRIEHLSMACAQRRKQWFATYLAFLGCDVPILEAVEITLPRRFLTKSMVSQCDAWLKCKFSHTQHCPCSQCPADLIALAEHAKKVQWVSFRGQCSEEMARQALGRNNQNEGLAIASIWASKQK